MAILSALLAWLGKQLSSLVQAVLGWSVTALFGRLPSHKQTALSVALLVSLFWPLMVVGVFVPAVSAWAFAFVPLQKWLGAGVVRWGSILFAVLLPPIVGAITRWVAPQKEARASTLRALAAGYPLTLGYFIACVVTAVTVPIVKIGSIVRGWEDEHVFVQPRPGEYERALEEIAVACDAAEAPAFVEPVPMRMRIASTVLNWFARVFVRPIVADEPKMARGAGLEVYLYPADVLLRGERDKVARVRATMTRTWLERYAFLVSDPAAQSLQEELQRLWHVVRRHRDPGQIGATARMRLREIAHDLERTSAPFEEWVILDRSLHRLERALAHGGELLHDDLAVRSVEKREYRQEGAMTDETMMTTAEARVEVAEPTAALVREALDETRDLVRLEVELAREELKTELTRAKAAGIALGAAGALSIAGFAMFMVAIATAFSMTWLAALIIGVILTLLAGAAGLTGWKALPKKPLGETKERLESDLKQLKERIA